MLDYLQGPYFRALEEGDHHVIQRIPMCIIATSPHSVNDQFSFHVVPFVRDENKASETFWGEGNKTMVLFSNRCDKLSKGTGWRYGRVSGPVDVEEPTEALVRFSRKYFLENRLLPIMAQLNGFTTFIASLQAGGGSKLRLKPSGQAGSWQPLESSSTALAFEWSVSSDSQMGTPDLYKKVHCNTRNVLEIPTNDRSGDLVIEVKGETMLSFTVEETGITTSATMSWEFPITIMSNHQLKVHLPSLFAPKITTHDSLKVIVELQHLQTESAEQALRKAFDRLIPQRLAQDLKEVFSAPGSLPFPANLGTPVFTRAGDILYEPFSRSPR
ncbi:hypothetical protein SISNIDRAFT_165257 [Sistotremastrum niveocremeum HHB9708]|uniref:Uncharacterized protein n=1 Tax=Sistotremastrum niveocremeum HHB9708 TaxID=1314777 RepID=A0A164SIU3_9AGAM|nr:hypothetical protein SISNIDRAFT_165257 [Sistotremastrum niveocremeum HHB9708]